MIVYDKKWCTITLDLERQRMIQQWKGFSSFDQFKEADDRALECFKKYKLRQILVDIRTQQLVSEEEKNYSASLMPELMENGLKEMAFVMPESLTARITVDEFKALFDVDLIAHFEDLSEAEQWLNERLITN
jgi:hypothetical protein